MKRFIVTTREVWCQGIQVEAEDELHAIVRVNRGEGDEIENLFEYSHQLPDSATAEEWEEDSPKVYLYTARILSKQPLSDDERHTVENAMEASAPSRSDATVSDDPEVAEASKYGVEDWFK